MGETDTVNHASSERWPNTRAENTLPHHQQQQQPSMLSNNSSIVCTGRIKSDGDGGAAVAVAAVVAVNVMLSKAFPASEHRANTVRYQRTLPTSVGIPTRVEKSSDEQKSA